MFFSALASTLLPQNPCQAYDQPRLLETRKQACRLATIFFNDDRRQRQMHVLRILLQTYQAPGTEEIKTTSIIKDAKREKREGSGTTPRREQNIKHQQLCCRQSYRNTLQVCVSLLEMVNQSSGRCNHNLDTRAKISQLTRLGDSTVDTPAMDKIKK